MTDATPPPLRRPALSGPGLDRAAARRTEPGLLATLLNDPATRVLPLRQGHVPVEPAPEGAGLRLATREPRQRDHERLGLFLGVDRQDAGTSAYLAVVEDDEPADGWVTLREVGIHLDPTQAATLAEAVALAHWHRTHPRCPRCGTPTQADEGGWTRVCPEDGSHHFPRTDPAVIVAVTDTQDRLLLARNQGWPEGRMSVLAGFVEPGETLEAAVRREVHEEVGVVLDEVTYLGDQPWPFPASLMLGFTARTRSDRLRLDETEIAEARWFTRQEYVDYLAERRMGRGYTFSIASRLIEHWLGRPLDGLL